MEKPYEIGSSPDGTYVFARAFRQQTNSEVALRLAGDLVHFGIELGVLGCLIDLRGTTSVSSVVEKYEFAHKEATVAGLPLHWRYALLRDHDDDSPDFMEIVMINAGYMLAVFEDEREAVAWLKGPAAGNGDELR